MLFDPSGLAAQGNPPTTTFSLHVRNIVGFFVDSWSGSALVGYIVPMPGNLITDAGAQHVSDEASFLRNVVLVR